MGIGTHAIDVSLEILETTIDKVSPVAAAQFQRHEGDGSKKYPTRG